MKNKPSRNIRICNGIIGLNHPTYFIADIAANHDGSLERAKDLIYLAASAGANAVKFQHFMANTIVSDYGFKNLGSKLSHQAYWKKSVFEVYKYASLNLDWTPILKETCDKANVAFLTSPYSLELVNEVHPYVVAYKIGSGDITWLSIIRHVCCKKKPVILATGASSISDVKRAVKIILEQTSQIILMQCNTNYTACRKNFKYINLNVLRKYAEMFPGVILGLSDHTHGHVTVLGAISLGARVIEKHFTDDLSREGPDHKFSMTPDSWREMVERSRDLELALGSSFKKVEDNERETVVLQRRSIRVAKNLKKGTTLLQDHLTVLRPCPEDGIPPFEIDKIIGRKLGRSMASGEHIKWTDLN